MVLPNVHARVGHGRYRDESDIGSFTALPCEPDDRAIAGGSRTAVLPACVKRLAGKR